MCASVTVNRLVLEFSIRKIRGHLMEQNLLCEDVMAISDITTGQMIALARHLLESSTDSVLHCVGGGGRKKV